MLKNLKLKCKPLFLTKPYKVLAFCEWQNSRMFDANKIYTFFLIEEFYCYKESSHSV